MSHGNGVTKLKLYNYIGIAKYLGVTGVCQFFFRHGVSGGRNAT